MQTFRKNERLYHKKSIDELFSIGQSFYVYPFKIIWVKSKEKSDRPARILISVPKRNFKKAVDRNRLKRLIKEAYRKRKTDLYQYLLNNKSELNFSIIYTASKKLTYNELEEKISLALNRLIKAHEETIG